MVRLRPTVYTLLTSDEKFQTANLSRESYANDVNSGGTDMAIVTLNQAMLQQQIADQQKAREWMNRIGHIPQGGPQLTHGNVNRAVNIGGARTSIEQGPGNVMTFAPGGPQWIQGLGVDLNGDGRFEHGKDGQLALDIDGDGKYTRSDIQDTLDMLRLFSGAGADVQGPGGFNQPHQAKLLLLQARGKQADLNQDGVLSHWELARMGGKVLVNDGKDAEKFEARALPGTEPVFQPRPQYPTQPLSYPPFGGHFGPPAFFNHFLHTMFSMMSFFARPF